MENLRTKLTLSKLIFFSFSKIIFLGMQENIQVYGKRPFGVGLLIIGYDVRF